MKQIGLFLGVAAAFAFAGSAHALDVDTFETYADTTALQSVWSLSAGLPGEDALLVTGGGANSTSNYMKLTDGGYSVYRTATDILTPPAGNYKLSFYWQNGIDSGNPWKAMTVSLTQNGNSKVSAVLSPASSPPAVTTWTFYESSTIALDGTNPITISVSAADNGATADNNAAIDEIILTPVAAAPPQISVLPDDRSYLSRTRTLTADVSFGSGSYTKVDFDVNNDSSIELTDTSAPFEFVWDTLTVMPQGTSGTVSIKATVTDSNSETASIVGTYTIDNEFDGRQILVDQDFNTFNGNLPDGFIPFQDTAGNATFGPGPDRDANPNQALLVTFTVSDFANRYAVRSVGDQGNFYNLQTSYWGKGSSNRIYYCTSPDDVTYTISNGTPAASVNSASWTYAVGAALNLGLAETDYVSVAPHQFAAGDHSYDDIHTEANKPYAASKVSGWNLY